METATATVDEEGRRRPTADDDEGGRVTAGAVAGAVGGVLATVTMTIYRLPIARSLPPTREFWAQYGPGESEGGLLVALLLHLGYGAGGGLAFGVAFDRFVPGTADSTREVAGLGLALVYGAALSLFGSRVLLSRLLDMDLDPDEVLVFHVSHAVYALTLGTWVGSRTRRSD